MHVTEIKSFAEFVKETEVYDLLADLVLFRGQPVQGNLIPSVARKDATLDTTADEKKVLEQLKLMGASLLGGLSATTELDLLVLAQHFELKTRLLDWTSNPLAALWFACADQEDGDVFVYSFIADNLLEANVYTSDPFAQSKTRAFQPRLNNARIIAQHGWFTLHRFSSKTKKFVPLEANPETKKHLAEFRIPAKYRAEILSSLDRYGVSHRTLFPDLVGLCRHLNWKHRLV